MRPPSWFLYLVASAVVQEVESWTTPSSISIVIKQRPPFSTTTISTSTSTTTPFGRPSLTAMEMIASSSTAIMPIESSLPPHVSQEMNHHHHHHHNNNNNNNSNNNDRETVVAQTFQELNDSILQFQQARLEALHKLNQLLKQLIALQQQQQEEAMAKSMALSFKMHTYNNVSTISNDQVPLEVSMQELVMQATALVQRIQKDQEIFVSEMSQLLLNHDATKSLLSTTTPALINDTNQQFATMHSSTHDNQQDETTMTTTMTTTTKKSKRQRLQELPQTYMYKYAAKMTPIKTPTSNPGLPVTASESLMANFKASQPILATELDKVVAEMTKYNNNMMLMKFPSSFFARPPSPPIVITSEMESLLTQLKKNQPILAAEMSQIVTDIQHLVTSIIAAAASSAAGGGGGGGGFT